ncbi:type IV toxin-antitoxin system AbiEi family antitoxin domain-containing protein [Sphingomonas canadensis]|uniref:Type IV toxin-antitoxin system AbiEi family antitoxin domain-containing protein n=1 Tax=Sphingomonas canadensis TaxID=1219257 RepID=A0ABW3HA60_9SPHN|nr:type IV toxin-antitoxin system AbiEi family antitoxin domain-containing protein [Sphingomonas canadensis]MCW3837443.1 type IV toxin-antitoxin system AbiEi family antitoxin domain-containing protein [Sphingomonas canadensis]
MSAVADKIIKRVRGKGRGWAFTPKDFLDLGTRASIDMALTRLVQAGQIRRIGRGLYDYPKLHDKLGALTPDADSIAQAVATQSGDRLSASGAQSANRLGISTQVPAKASYATSGQTRVKKVAGRTIALKRSRAPILDDASQDANAVLQLLAHVGKANIDDDLIHRLASQLDDRDLKALRKAQPLMPGWMSDAVHKIGLVRHG